MKSIKQMLDILDPRGLKREIAQEEQGLDFDEKKAAEYMACEDVEVAEALQLWAVLSTRGREKRFDEALLDRLEYLLQRAIQRQSNLEVEGLEGDEHEQGIPA